MHFRTKFAALAIAGAVASLVLAATPALASSQPVGHASTITPETAYGAIYGKPATAEFVTIPLSWHGLVNTHGTFAGHGKPPAKGQEHAFPTAAGNLVGLVTAPPQQGQTFKTTTCYFTYTTTVVFAIVPSKSTGKFAGATGPGRGEGLLRRVRAEVHVRSQEGPVQHQPERARADERRGRVLRPRRVGDDQIAVKA